MAKTKKWYRASLRLMGDGLSVNGIESKLRLKPSYVGVKGERVDNNPRRGKYETNVWGWRSPCDSTVPFEEQIAGLLERIEPVRSELLEILSLPHTEGELFLGFGSANGQGGAYLPPDLLRRVAACGLALSLDLYPHDMDQIEAEELSMI
ncbi:MAG TPA: DUF4279 domain-containing protein [Pyrinomonadaceae bacterium]|jgi:hypothetical protein